MKARAQFTGVVLAGGRGQRMGDRDKGLLLLRGRPLAQWVIERFQPQVDRLLISANRHAEQYAVLGGEILGDEFGGYAGPLAGLHAAMLAARTPWVATVPCDSPFLPLDLVARLADTAQHRQAPVVTAHDGQQEHPVFCLCRTSLLPALNDFLSAGQRRMRDWLASAGSVCADFSDQPAAFANLNTPDELSALERSLCPTQSP